MTTKSQGRSNLDRLYTGPIIGIWDAYDGGAKMGRYGYDESRNPYSLEGDPKFHAWEAGYLSQGGCRERFAREAHEVERLTGLNLRQPKTEHLPHNLRKKKKGEHRMKSDPPSIDTIDAMWRAHAEGCAAIKTGCDETHNPYRGTDDPKFHA